MKDIKQHFKEFLEKEGAYENYLNNTGSNEIPCAGPPPNFLILLCFSWIDSPQGDRYWNQMHNKWKDHLKTIEQ